ncbi:SIMPL domain-containing protein [Budvicia aquatica]|uniref:Protein of uncharacterized function (DUF541) n=1 Tax=Budvicia aquatica TaxID=82979 RepID=A0A2C6DFY3_9GAMM|nr:SIMPL domain-containing protein [Budvicia aquatica]PHI29198.1 SIMPL domain-containing protein [Budvicia aquatica]VFS47398.1 Protein of uncharacterised function (DUF541) [Budvicia aquatica]
MKKRTLLIALLSLSVLPAFYTQCSALTATSADSPLILSQMKYGSDYVVVGSINTTISDVIKLSPDTVEFSITYISEGSTPNDASNRNSNNMKKLNTAMYALGITDQDLTTVAYQNYELTSQQEISNGSTEYHQSSITVSADITQDKVFNVIKSLETNNILNIEKNQYDKQYSFKIIEIGSNSETTAKLAKDKYQKIEKILSSLGVDPLTIQDYENSKTGPKTEEIKKYYVNNTIKIKVTNFDNLGKIIAKAQELKMTVNNDMTYSVSDNARDKIIEDREKDLLNKLTAKTERLLGNSPNADYQLGYPSTLTSGTVNPVNPYIPRMESLSAVINSGQMQNVEASNINIQPPSEYEITLSISGTFDVIKPVIVSNSVQH